MDERKTALIFKAFCDENRIRILKMLTSGEKCACKMLEELNVTQPTLSHHMKILCDSGVVVAAKKANGCTISFRRKVLIKHSNIWII